VNIPPTAATPTPVAVPAPVPAPAAPTPEAPSLVAVTAAYLAIGSALATDQAASAAQIDTLTRAAAALGEAGGGPLAREAAQAAEKLRGVDLAGQRRAWRRVGEAVIRLAEARTPETPLHVFRCEMFPGRWLQADETVRNPFYGNQMLRCGERVLVLRRDTGEAR